MQCKYPQHHESSRGGVPFGLVGLVLAAAVVVEVIRYRAVIETVLVWSAVAVVLGVVVVVLAMGRSRSRHLLLAVKARFTWRWMCRNLQLARPDLHRPGRVRHLRARIRVDRYGVTARVKTRPGTGRAEFDKAAEHIADSWRVGRVSVSQPRPGRLVVRGLRRDPLIEPLGPDVLPPFDGYHVILGRDDTGDVRRINLANLSGSVIAGNPGRGKTESASSLAVQLVPSPAVEFYILDGGACDWAPFAPAAAAYCDDNLADAEELLLELHQKMMSRRRNLEADLGSRNGWKQGPTASYPLRWLLVEEASWYFDLEAVKGDRDRERRVRACRGLVAQLLRRGRAPMHHTTLVVQNPVGAGGLPPELRNLCGVRWSFGVATTETAVAALGDDIRRYESLSPTLLQGPEHVGVASVLLRSGSMPYTMVKFPGIGDLADQVAAAACDRRISSASEPVTA